MNLVQKNVKKRELASEFKVFCYGEREGLLFEMVKKYKYGPVRGLGRELAELLAGIVELEDAVVVPLPTIPRHVRERGFDHMKLMAKKLARMRGFRYAEMLRRANNKVQVGADARTRAQQAETAYEAVSRANEGVKYLLVDDVWTTGASMQAAARVMRAAGAKEIYGAVLAAGE